MKEALAAAGEIVAGGADPAALLRDLYGDLHDLAVARATGEEGEETLEWCLAAAEIVARHVALAERSRAPRASLDLGLLAVSRLGDVRDLEELVSRLERLSAGAPGEERMLRTTAEAPARPAPEAVRPAAARPAPDAERPEAAAPQAPSRPGLRLELPGRKQPLEARPAPAQNEPPLPAPGATLTGEELDQIRSIPQVREALRIFGGMIEQIGRTEDGEVVR
jgi:hypothetical protein